MIKECGMEQLRECAEIAYMRNSAPENACAYCSGSYEAICSDFEDIIKSDFSLMLGYFDEGGLAGLTGFFMNPENRWIDCVGPFFRDKWSDSAAREMLEYARRERPNADRFNFYFNVKNGNCLRLMESLPARRRDNEYILLLKKADYRPCEPAHRVVRCTPAYEEEVIRLHDETFPDIYVTGREIIASSGKTREVFCAPDENGGLAGYGVLKYSPRSGHLTAEIFAVRESYRGRGYGWALLNAAVASGFENHGGEKIDLVVDKLNTHARELYYSCGFKLAVENCSFEIRLPTRTF